MILGILESGLPLVGVNKIILNVITQFYMWEVNCSFLYKYTCACKNINVSTSHSVQLFSH